MGKSTIAINLAAYLSYVVPNLSVCEVDMDVEHGDTYLLSLGEKEKELMEGRQQIPTMYDLVRAMEIGAVKTPQQAKPFFILDAFSGCSFLASPHYPSQGAQLGEREMEMIFSMIKELGHNLIIFDCGVNLRDEVTQYAIMSAQQLIFVAEVSTSSINRVIRGIAEISASPEFTIPLEKMKLVFNKIRRGEDVGLDPQKVAEKEFGFLRHIYYFDYDVRVARLGTMGFWESTPLVSLSS